MPWQAACVTASPERSARGERAAATRGVDVCVVGNNEGEVCGCGSMTSTADAGIDALRSTHDGLVAVVRDLSDEQLVAPSGATEWTVAQVLSHLGSGAEISAATLRSAVEGLWEPA